MYLWFPFVKIRVFEGVCDMCGYVWCEDVYVRVKGYVGENRYVGEDMWVKVGV